MLLSPVPPCCVPRMPIIDPVDLSNRAASYISANTLLGYSDAVWLALGGLFALLMGVTVVLALRGAAVRSAR